MDLVCDLCGCLKSVEGLDALREAERKGCEDTWLDYVDLETCRGRWKIAGTGQHLSDYLWGLLGATPEERSRAWWRRQEPDISEERLAELVAYTLRNR